MRHYPFRSLPLSYLMVIVALLTVALLAACGRPQSTDEQITLTPIDTTVATTAEATATNTTVATQAITTTRHRATVMPTLVPTATTISSIRWMRPQATATTSSITPMHIATPTIIVTPTIIMTDTAVIPPQMNVTATAMVSKTTAITISTATATPTATEPIAPAATTVPTPTIVLTKSITSLMPFVHASGLFSLHIPVGWHKEEPRQSGQVTTIWRHPSQPAFVMMLVASGVPPLTTDDDTVRFFQQVVRQVFGNNPNFTDGTPVPQYDGSIFIPSQFTQEQGGIPYTVLNDAFLALNESKERVTLLAIGVPEQTYEQEQQTLNEIIASLRCDQTVAIAGSVSLQPITINELEPYIHASGVFSLTVPVGWDATEQSTPDMFDVQWTAPTQSSVIRVRVAAQTISSQQLYEQVQGDITALYGNQPGFAIEYPTFNYQQVRVVWHYTLGTLGYETTIQGNSLIMQRDKSVVIMHTIVPRENTVTLQEPLQRIEQSLSIKPTP